ncbi:unnamed protein product [Parascedosporium putredinis]|uniref:CAP-Gly domain-containing protein n=1 Tax=Parascedosporium putredinis TaxID=1442378 RepID=A0A9P1GVS4_9PEZI|nr:unnamed protein product [Parascedosporium putredinis]CAI7988767.1 unnamed protein product [Parascedosporium putredinis]
MFLYPGYGTLDRVDHSNPGFHTLTQPFEPILTPDDSSEAFILYRQHHQAAVTAQHPRLPNPDVSKIIGEQWRNENETVKEYWKKLAEEEKRRHHELYPDYRYTPRRGGRCGKCGGRLIATPRTPSAQLPPLRTPRVSYAQMPIADEGPGYRHGQMPQGSSHPSQAYNFHGGTGLKSIQEEDSPMFATPEPKRRRFEDARSRLSDTPVPSGFAPFHDAYETPILTGDKSYDSQEEGVVAMVMSVPHMRKMHIISQIAPPYRTKDPVNNKSMTRGCFIVVEGPVDATLKAVGAAVERALRGYEEVSLKTFTDPEPLPLIRGLDPGHQASYVENDNLSCHLESYTLRLLNWRKRSAQIVEHITTAPQPTVQGHFQRSLSDSNIAADISTAIEGRGGADTLTTSCRKQPWSDEADQDYAYAPTEHWQWMATQWRGMVGPDLFVYVKPTADPGINLRNTVELKSPNVMLVRVPMEGTLDEKTERRLAFEIVEWRAASPTAHHDHDSTTTNDSCTTFDTEKHDQLVRPFDDTTHTIETTTSTTHVSRPLPHRSLNLPGQLPPPPSRHLEIRDPSRNDSSNQAVNTPRTISKMSDISVGHIVQLPNGRKAEVKFIGETAFAVGVWVGLELEDDSGKNDGSVQGTRYFNCDMGRGMFMKPTNLKVIGQVPQSRSQTSCREAGLLAAQQYTGRPLSSSASSSRTNTPSNARVPSIGVKPKPAGGVRTSMGPPALPKAGAKPATSSTTANRQSIGGASRLANRMSLTSSKPPSRAGSIRRPSADSQATGADSRRSSKEEAAMGSDRSETEILQPKPTSPVLTKSNTVDRLTAAAAQGSAPASRGARPAGTDAANRKIADLETKIKILERKAMENRDKLANIPKLQQDLERYQAIIQKLQSKAQENNESRKMVKEMEQTIAALQDVQADHEQDLESMLLDREMAEEQLEHARMDLEVANERLEVLQLEFDILKAEREEAIQGLSPEERASESWIAKERENERLREALVRFRDITREKEAELLDQNAALEEDLKDFSVTKDQLGECREKLGKSEDIIEDLRGQLENALGAEDLIEDLTHRNMSLGEEVNELKAVIDELETLKELNDELEANHDQGLEDMEYTLSRFRQLVTTLQADLEDMRASHAVTETESEKLNDRSRAMMDLNMKLQLSASKAQAKAIDLELRRLEAQEAEQHLEIVKLFLPDSYKEDQNSVLAYLRFQRVAFKANMLQGFIGERIDGQAHPGHEDDVFYGRDAIDKLTWVSAMCERFASTIRRCTPEGFVKFESALHELDPVERALNTWIDGLRKDDLKEKKCADELQRTIAVLAHLAEVHLGEDLASFADETYMQALNMQSYLESATVSFTTLKAMVQRVLASAENDEGDLSQHFVKRAELAIGQTRSAKLVAARAVRALEDLKTRSLSLQPESRDAFEQVESAAQDLANLACQLGVDLHAVLTEEGRSEPYTFAEVQNTISKTTTAVTSSSESDLFSTYLTGLRVSTTQLNDLAALCADLDQVQEFDTRPVDAEEEMRRLREEYNEARRAVAQRDDTLSTALLKIETLESRMKDAQAKVNRIGELEGEIESSKKTNAGLVEDIEKQDRELRVLEAERDKWKKVAGDNRAFVEGVGEANVKVGQERAVATARQMDGLRGEVSSLQEAVRYLRQDNKRARTTEQHSHAWLAEPLRRPTTVEQRRRAAVAAEGRDVLGELLRMATSAKVYDLSALPEDKLAWRRAKSTPQYHAAKQAEDYAAWKSWRTEVVKKSKAIRLPGADGKVIPGTGRDVQIVGSAEWERLQAAGRVVV